jgi:hypothetical protein
MVHIVQCLCPSRHCVLAVSYDPANPDPEATVRTPEQGITALRTLVEAAISKSLINPWCGICGSRTFTYEDAETRWKTMEEAMPYLKASEAEQANVRRHLQSRN